MNVERLLLAELLIDNKKISPVRALLSDGGFFDKEEHQQLYNAILAAYDSHAGFVDIPILIPAMTDIGMPESELIKLQGDAVTGEAAEEHARIVAESFLWREAKKSLVDLVKALSRRGDIFEFLEGATQCFVRLLSMFQRHPVNSMSVATDGSLEYLQRLWSDKKPTVPFCFEEIDDITGGMDGGDLIVIAGLEKSGKSSLMIQTLFANAILGRSVLLFSTEMTQTQIILRKALMDTRLSYTRMRSGRLSGDEQERLRRSIREMSQLPVYMRYGMLTIADIMADAEKFVKDRGVALIAVDYLQRIIPIGSAREPQNREREIAAISSSMKNLSMTLGVPVITLSQLNEEMRARESRAIEQDMDKMLTIERIPDNKRIGNYFDVGLRIKQRFGPSGDFGDVVLEWDNLVGCWVSPKSKSRSAESMLGPTDDERVF